jgi:hypothetical protein
MSSIFSEKSSALLGLVTRSFKNDCCK